MKKINNNILEVRIPDEYCIYVRNSLETREYFSDTPKEGSGCWAIKHLTFIFLTKKLNIGHSTFVEPKQGFEYYYTAKISLFLLWYAGIALILSALFHRKSRSQ